MAVNQAEYTVSARIDPEAELRELRWPLFAPPPVQEATELIYEAWQERDYARDALEGLINTVPPRLQHQVMEYILEHHNGNSTEHPAHGESQRHYQAEHNGDPGLLYDLERTQDPLDYVNEVCGPHAAQQLVDAMAEHRNLSATNLRGEVKVYHGDVHATAVIDQELYDTWNCADMGDQTKYQHPSRLRQLWLATDNPSILNTAHDIIAKYRRVRQFDDTLSYGAKWRHTRD